MSDTFARPRQNARIVAAIDLLSAMLVAEGFAVLSHQTVSMPREGAVRARFALKGPLQPT